MKRSGVTSLLLMLSLEALLLVAGLSAAVSVDGMGTIRLPSDGKGFADLVTAMTRATKGGKERRPWECCDVTVCTRSFPPTCRCLDIVDRCSSACKSCKETDDSRYKCTDWYHGDPGPSCRKDGNNHGGLADEGVMTMAREAVNKKEDTKRPWKCCNLPICTKSWPLVCRCWDVVKQCASACKRCEEVKESGPRSYHCVDAYRGDPGPRCSHTDME